MSTHLSFLKARYCLAVLNTASISPDDEARHLIECLVTEPLTPNLAPEAKIAERDALATIMTLFERLRGRSITAVSAEWKLAKEAVLCWVAEVDEG